MKKLGLIALALVVALGMAGVGYAYWTDSIVINGNVNTGNLSIRITEAGSDDPAGQNDPGYAYNVAETIATRTDDSATITINRAYPGYSTGANVTVQNTGNVPVKVLSINVVPTSGNMTLFYFMTLDQWNFEGAQPAIGEVLMPGVAKTFDADFHFDARPGDPLQMPMDAGVALTATIVVTQFNDPATPTVTIAGTPVIP